MPDWKAVRFCVEVEMMALVARLAGSGQYVTANKLLNTKTAVSKYFICTMFNEIN
jgi:hypothetical protein